MTATLKTKHGQWLLAVALALSIPVARPDVAYATPPKVLGVTNLAKDAIQPEPDFFDGFGKSVAAIGDLDGNGSVDRAGEVRKGPASGRAGRR